VTTFIALLAAIGIGTIIAALLAHLTTISNFRQAWINALQDDLSEFFKSLEAMNYALQDYFKDSVAGEEKRRTARIAILFAYERIRLRLNRDEALHIELERKLRAFLDEPLGDILANRAKVDETAEVARRLLKAEWATTKYPWLTWFPKSSTTNAAVHFDKTDSV
jgi:hypothetical protein